MALRLPENPAFFRRYVEPDSGVDGTGFMLVPQVRQTAQERSQTRCDHDENAAVTLFISAEYQGPWTGL